jgi:glycosyltransferase involved in cell wall biosynthesis
VKLSIIIPVFNEAPTLDHLIKRIQDVPIEKEIVIVDDGSFDGTEVLLKKYMGRKNFKYFSILQTRGREHPFALQLRIFPETSSLYRMVT